MFPEDISYGVNLHSLISSIFLHGGLLHLGGNMLFLYIYGDNLEDELGHMLFLGFYLACGALANVAQVLADPASPIPVVGASGAIAGVMGAYLVWFPWARVRTVILLAFIPIWPRIPAIALLIVWFVSQFYIGDDAGIAWVAHVAGFVFGVVAGIIARTDDAFERSLLHQYRRMARIR